MAAVAFAGNAAALLPDEVLQDKVLEVGRDLNWPQAYEDRAQGLFIWRITLKPSPNAASECNGFFVWYLKRVGDDVGLHDPISLPECRPDIKQWDRAQILQLSAEMKTLQEDFKRRWLARVGPVTLKAPTRETHPPKVLADALARLNKPQ